MIKNEMKELKKCRKHFNKGLDCVDGYGMMDKKTKRPMINVEEHEDILQPQSRGTKTTCKKASSTTGRSKTSSTTSTRGSKNPLAVDEYCGKDPENLEKNLKDLATSPKQPKKTTRTSGNSESEGKDFKDYFYAPENYGTWKIQEETFGIEGDEPS